MGYIQDFNRRATIQYLIEQEWTDLPADFDDTDIAARLTLDLPTWDEVSGGDKKPSFTKSSLIEVNQSRSEVNARDFCMPEWVPMLKKTGKKVGEGAFKDVYVIETTCSQDQNVKVAVAKEKLAGNIADSEVKYGTDIDHPYVIKVFEAGSKYGLRRMLMEAASGGDLKKKYRTLTSKALAKVILELMVAVAYLHKDNIVHADLKAEQVLLSEDCSTGDCVAKLGDLGLACKAGSYACKAWKGTPNYMAPEVYKYGEVTLETDMWSVGITIYWLTHRGSFPHWLGGFKTMNQLSKFMKSGIFSLKGPLHQGSSTLDKLIAGCFDRRPNKRLTASQAVELAKTYAAEKGLSKSAIQSIMQHSNAARVSLPLTWQKCMAKHCGYEQCVEQKNNPGKVQCGTHTQPDLKLPPIKNSPPSKSPRVVQQAQPESKLPAIGGIAELPAGLPAWVEKLPGKWVPETTYVARRYEIVKGHQGFTLAVFFDQTQKGVGGFNIGKFELKHEMVEVRVVYHSVGRKTPKDIHLRVKIMPDPNRPLERLIVTEEPSEWDPLVRDLTGFVTSPKGFRKLPY